MSRNFSKRQVRDALNHRSRADVSHIHQTPIGAPDLVYRPEKDRWESPYSLLDLKGEDAIILLPHPSGLTKFRTTVVKPYIVDSCQDFQDEEPAVHNGPAVNVVQLPIKDTETLIVSMNIPLSRFDVSDFLSPRKAVVL